MHTAIAIAVVVIAAIAADVVWLRHNSKTPPTGSVGGSGDTKPPVEQK